MSMDMLKDGEVEYMIKKATEYKLMLAENALRSIRDSTFRNAMMLRGIAAEALDRMKESK